MSQSDAPQLSPKQLIEAVRSVLSAVKNGTGPVAVVVNNNQPGAQHIIETAPNVTLDVGTKLYAAPVSEIPAQPQVPDGWKLVPREPTQAQLEAFAAQFFSDDWREAERPAMRESREAYAVFLAAAPSRCGNEEKAK